MSIFAIIVSYNPDDKKISETVLSLINQVNTIVIVKNSMESLVFAFDDINKIIFSEKLHIIQLERNMGIAYAQNRGIEYALSHGADYVLFSDQDTLYPVDFIKKSLVCFERHKNEKIAAVVPYFYNENKKQFAQVSVTKTKSIDAEIGKDYYLAHAISSGSLCHVSVLETAGMMNERLFIDFVDTEWCWRATKMGFNIICDTTNIIHHSMGDSFKKILGKKIVVYSDFRNYFFLRNGIYLLFHSHLLKFYEGLGFYVFMFKKTILYFITTDFSYKHIKLYLKALRRGLLNNFTMENI